MAIRVLNQKTYFEHCRQSKLPLSGLYFFLLLNFYLKSVIHKETKNPANCRILKFMISD